MVSPTFLAGALAALSARAVVAGPCRPVSSSTVQVSYSSATTDSTSVAIISSSTQIQFTETLSTDTLSTEASLTLPTDVTTSTVEEAITTTTEGLTTTELTTSVATTYHTTETSAVESATTTASETTTSEAPAVPTAFKFISYGGTTNGLALKATNEPSNHILVTDAVQGIFTYDSETGQLSCEGLTLCLYREDSDWNAVVKTCSSQPNPRDTPLICEKPVNGDLKCRVPGAHCEQRGQCPSEIPDCPSEPTTVCEPTGEEWSQFFVRNSLGTRYTLHLGIENPTAEQNDEWHLQPVRLQIEPVDDS